MRAFRRRPLEFLTAVHRQHGDVAHFRLFRQNTYLLAHPDFVRELLINDAGATIKSLALQRSKNLLGEGLLTSEPPLHTRQRRLLQPAFHREKLEQYATQMVEVAERWLDAWEQRGIGNAPFDLHNEMMQLTLTTVTRTMFSADVGELAQELSGITNTIISMFPYLLLPFADHIEDWPLPISRRFRAARGRLDHMIQGLIAERRTANTGGRGDLLSMLLDAQDTEGDGGGMSDRQVRDELVTIFMAGHETIANALSWTWYLLALHPEAEARLHRELDQVLGGRPPSVAEVESLRFTRAVLAEAMRLFPPVWAVSRLTKAPLRFGGYELPPRSLCILSQWVTHRDPRFWPDAGRFLPERWLDAAEAPPKYAYFPFGAGSRVCIGERFAWMEGTLLLALFAQRWVFRLQSSEPVVPLPLITLRQRGGLPVTAQLRRGA